MGQKSTYRCNLCEYTVLTSGGHDYGFSAVTDTYICRNCREIVDVLVGVDGETYTIEEAKNIKTPNRTSGNFYKCPKCKSDIHIIKWNTKRKPCPRCMGTLILDKEGNYILWD
jgi:DNA-directed RNA polymerase subunit RPC12/RpoP